MRKISCLVLVVLSGLTIRVVRAIGFPEAEINNGIVHARLYLPDSEKGYYRGTRFDWSGVMPILEYKGHSYCGQWFEKYAPTIHDAIMGPVESFSPVGYDDAGGRFVQIGVGVLARTGESPYSPFTYYKVLDPGTWKVKLSPDQVDFLHQLKDTAYSYDYRKIVQLVKGRPELVLAHSLKNTGTRALETDVYDHNFFVLDERPTGPGLELRFPFLLTSEDARGLGELAAIRGNSIMFLRQLVDRESVYAVLHGYGDQPTDYDIRLENHMTGAGLRITCDRPLSKLVYWGSPKTLCPEPYVRVKVQPGETFTWRITYEFYICDRRN
jgi:hypothetical protein